jgi:hypothetical protein
MQNQKRLRCFLVCLTLLGLLFMTATFGGALHHHENSTSENTCPICHLSHQPIERPIASNRLPALLPAGPTPEPFNYEFAPAPMTRRLPARAPPAV